jgi:hypothetical protein
VKALLDAGTCNSVTTTSTICGDASLSSSYYETFTYNNYRDRCYKNSVSAENFSDKFKSSDF